MKLPLLFLILLAPSPLMAVLPDDRFRSGEAALADELWEVAAIHFGEILNSKSLTPAEKSRASLRLAEALIRGDQPSQALELLEKLPADASSGLHFWKGQALAGLGRLDEAVKEFTLESQSPGSLFPIESDFTRAALLLSLGRADDALSALRPLAGNSDPAISVEARLREAEILLDLQRPEDARKTMPQLAEVPVSQLARANFIDAALALSEKNFVHAADQFGALIGDPTGQTLARHHAAALGFADAVAAQGDRARAADSLLSFVQLHPDSPVLDEIFQRLLEWLPAEPLPNDPILNRLSQWIPADSPPITGLISTSPSSILGAWPVVPPPNDLAAFALFTRAIGLHRIATPPARQESERLLTRLQLDYPQHFLTHRAQLQNARWLLDEGKLANAFAILDMVREDTGNPAIQGEAAFLEGRAAYDSGNLEAAIQRFDQASKSLGGRAEQSSRLNAAISRLRNGQTIPVALTGNESDAALNTDLELEKALSTTPPAAARTAIELFLNQFPKHPRVPEARLAMAEAGLSTDPPDLSMARAQLDTIAADPAALATVPPARFALARLRLTDLSGDKPATIAAARAYLTDYPDDPSAPEVSLTLGRSLYETDSYNDALLVLEKLAKTDTDPARAQAAWLIAARSAALVGTPQSRDLALTLFDRAAEAHSTLGPIVMMEKARLMIDLNRLPEATAFLRKWFRSLPPSDPLRVPAGLLFGEASYAQGSRNPEALTEALAVYDELLKHPETKPALVNRIQYLRGMTLEQLPRASNPALKRDDQALDAYYSVLDQATTPPAEWHYLERSGFRALEILEKDGRRRAPAALKLAKKIASFKGPRAEEAANRARQIQLNNFIYED